MSDVRDVCDNIFDVCDDFFDACAPFNTVNDNAESNSAMSVVAQNPSLFSVYQCTTNSAVRVTAQSLTSH
jgi:hypothetical protein